MKTAVIGIALLGFFVSSLTAAENESARKDSERFITIEIRKLEVTQEQVGDLKKAFELGSLLHTTRMTIPEGRRSTASDITEREVSSEVKVHDEGLVAIEVSGVKVLEGAKMEALAVISPDGKSIHIRLKAEFHAIDCIEKVKEHITLVSGGRLPEQEVEVERAKTDIIKLDTEFDLLDGGVVLLAGNLTDKKPGEGEEQVAVKRNVMVLGTARIVLTANEKDAGAENAKQ